MKKASRPGPLDFRDAVGVCRHIITAESPRTSDRGDQSVLEKKPKVRQAEWARLQTAQHWTALKQYDRATVALAELGRADDEMVNRLSASLRGAAQTVRQSGKAEGL